MDDNSHQKCLGCDRYLQSEMEIDTINLCMSCFDRFKRDPEFRKTMNKAVVELFGRNIFVSTSNGI